MVRSVRKLFAECVAKGMAVVITFILLLNGAIIVKSEENWITIDERVAVRFEDNGNKVIVWYKVMENDNIVITYEYEDNRIIYSCMLGIFQDNAYIFWEGARDRIDHGIGWIGDDGRYNPYGPADYQINVNTSSPVTIVETDTVNRVLYFIVVGPIGVKGDITVTVTKNLIASPENVKGYLDNQQINLTITENGYFYDIKAEYTHSVRTLMIDFGPRPIAGAPIWGIAIGSLLAVIAVIGALYWFKFRK